MDIGWMIRNWHVTLFCYAYSACLIEFSILNPRNLVYCNIVMYQPTKGIIICAILEGILYMIVVSATIVFHQLAIPFLYIFHFDDENFALFVAFGQNNKKTQVGRFINFLIDNRYILHMYLIGFFCSLMIV